MAVTIDQKKLVNKTLKLFARDVIIDALEQMISDLAIHAIEKQTKTKYGPAWETEGVDLLQVHEKVCYETYEAIRKWVKENKKSLKL